MSCEEFLHNLSLMPQVEMEISPEQQAYKTVKFLTEDICSPVIFAFGIIGNILNLVVLTRKRLRGRLNIMEKSAIYGLFGLAISDLLFCLVGFPYSFVKNYGQFGNSSMTLMIVHYNNSHPALMNTFLLTSTWIIVYVSVERFIGVVFPFKAREIVSLYRTTGAIVIIYVISALLNVPLYMRYNVISMQCADECVCYLSEPSTLFKGDFPLAYHVIWGVIGTILPFIVLIYCNVSISLTIYRRRNHDGAHYNSRALESAMRATTILLTIVVMYLVLVCPSMILKFLHHFLNLEHGPSAYRYRIAIQLSNVLQALNFAINFVLYCVISRTFRQAFRYSFCYQRSQSLSHTAITGESSYPLMDTKLLLKRQSTRLTSQSV